MIKPKGLVFFAVILLVVASAGWGQSAKDMIKQGQVDLKSARWDPAINNFKEALKLDGSLLDAQTGLAQAFLGKGTLDPSLRPVVEGIKKNTGESLAKLGKAYGEAGLWEEASLSFTEALRRKYEPVQTGLDLAQTFLERGSIDEAKAQYEGVLKLDPNNFMAQVGLANCLRETGQYDQAVEKYDAILKSTPNFAPAHLGKGKCLDRQRKYNEAYEEVKLAVKADPQYPEAHLELGDAFLNYFQDKQGRSLKIGEAIAEFETYTRLRPKDGTGFYQLAKVYQMRGDSLSKAKGAQAARQAAALESSNDAIWELLGTLFLDTKNYDEALPALEKSVALAPTADRWYKLGKTYQSKADGIAKGDSSKAGSLYENALGAFDKAVQLDGKHSDAWFYSGMANYSLKKYDPAEAAFGKVIELEPQKMRGYYWRGFTRAQGKKDYDNAANDLEMAIKVRPDLAQAYIALAHLYVYMGDIHNKDRALYLKARGTVEAGQKADPKNEEWDKILKDIKDRGVR
jgi:tetratricopeptide (TPR) repeat protein